MKMKYSCIISLITLVTFISCTEVLFDPVGTDTFVDTITNTGNLYNDLYKDILDDYADMGVPGISVAINTPDRGWWVGSAGMACIEDQVAMKPNHLHHSASMGKPYIGTLILRLYEDGLIGLDDPIKEYIPEDVVNRIANADVATIRQLLKHTSGIVDFEEDYRMFIDIFNDPSAHFSLDDVFENYVYGKSAYFEAGEGYHYSNTGYSLLGMIIDSISGMSLGDYFEQEIIIPLGLKNTYYKSYVGYPDSLALCVNSYFEFHPGELQNCTDLQKNLSKLAMGHEGVVASPYDFALFIKKLMSGNILKPATVELMLTDEVDMSEYFARGLGITHYRGDIRIYGESYGHGGESAGTQTQMLYFPDTEVTIVVACNLGSVVESINSERFGPMLNELINVIFTGKREGND